MDFARKEMEKYGWSDGKGLGREENGISQALKPKLKFDNSGVGHNAGEQFTNNWWERVFNSAAENIHVEDTGSEVRVQTIQPDAVDISTRSYSVKHFKKDVNMEYGTFIKTSKLTENGTENYALPILETVPLKSYQGLTDEQLFEACGGRTAHKGARHGLKFTGKLSRIEKQERMLLKRMKRVSLSDADENCNTEKKLKKIKKLDKFRQIDPDEPSCSIKKKKKKKSVSFNETVTKIYTPDLDTSFESGSVRDDSNNNSGSDEGIEQDVENNNNDLDNHKAFEEARLNFSDLSKAERKKLKKKRKLEQKSSNATAVFLSQIVDEQMQDDRDASTKKRKYLEESEETRSSTESPDRLKRKKNKKKKRKQKKEEAKVINSIAKSLEGFCRISESE